MDSKTISIIATIVLAYFAFTTSKVVYQLVILILQIIKVKPIYRKPEEQYLPYLETYFPFYRQLSPEKKRHFEQRVQLFIDIKKFVPRGGLKTISPELKVLTAGAAIQITFGYPDIYLRHFRYILFYPDNYYSRITHHYHQGEVNLRGIIVLSANNLISGFHNATDGRNLGLHEMAHALNIENLIGNSEFNFIDKQAIESFKREAKFEMGRIINGEETLFRSYGATNYQEFFAVAVENFFERSQEFWEQHPTLFKLMAQLLNQP